MRLLTILLATSLVACRDKAEDTDTADTSSLVVEADADGDGYSVEDGDCNDDDATISPAGVEICDGVDNDCDGSVDEDVTATFYADSDGDGFGDADDTTEACDQPAGTVSVPNDCDDADADSYPGAAERCDDIDNDCDGEIDEDVVTTWYADADQDGYGDPDVTTDECDPPSRYVDVADDCDDLDPTAYPDAVESCDEADNNCNGVVDEGVTSTYYIDADADSYGSADETTDACEQPNGYATVSGDCDESDADVNPAATELCDGVDNDCDGTTDEDDAADVSTWHADTDGDGYGDASTAADACEAPSGYVSDDTDCDDGDSSANPGEAEVCDEVDNDCNGLTDEDAATDAATWYADADSDGYGSTVSTVACDQPSGYASVSGDCDDGEPAANPGETETCDEIDNDCDGSVDEGLTSTFYLDYDGDGYGDTDRSTTACEAPSGYVSDDTDCDDVSSSANPGEAEVCDEADNDCDGSTDEDVTTTYYVDSDGDGYGDVSDSTDACSQPSGYATDSTDCDDGEPAANPGETETCDSIDNDCDSSVDEGVVTTYYADIDGDGYGDASDSTDACTTPSGYVSDSTDCDDGDSSANPGETEVCDEIDNDCDSSVDEGLTSTFYPDADGDGYGDTDAPSEACTAPSGYISDGTDCDDDDASANPGAVEDCRDGIDTDCNGTADDGEVGDEGCPGDDCDDVLNSRSTAPGDGVYWVDPTGADAYEAYCDMTSEDGGWTLLAVFTNNDSSNWNAYSTNWHTAGEFGSPTSPSTNADAKSQAFDDMSIDEVLIMEYPSSVDLVTKTGCIGDRPLIEIFQRNSESDGNCAYACSTDYVTSPWSGQSLQNSTSLRFRCMDNDGYSSSGGYTLGTDDNSMITTLNNGSYDDYNFGLGAGYGTASSSNAVDWDKTTNDSGDDGSTTQILLLGR